MSIDPRRGFAGQALVESLVGIAVLAALAMLVVLLGKYQSIAWSTIAASRAVAFGCAIVPDGCVDGDVPQPLFAAIRDAAFGSRDDATASVEPRALWHDRRGAQLFDRVADTTAVTAAAQFDAGASLAGNQRIAGIAQPMRVVTELAGPGRFGLDIAGGLREAQVTVHVQRSRPSRLDRSLVGMQLRIEAHTAVLGDSWSASGPVGDAASVTERVDRGRRLGAPIEAGFALGYAPARALLGLAGAIGLEDGAEAFRPGEIDVDLVPPDRLP